MRKAVVIACLFATGLAAPALAANARHPYANCDRKIDNCGPTGDNMTDQLNAQQLGGNGGMQGGQGMGGQGMGGPGMGGQGMQGSQGMQGQGMQGSGMQGGPGMQGQGMQGSSGMSR